MIRTGGVTDIACGFWGWLEKVSDTSLRPINTSPGCYMVSAISQLKVLASHKTNFESVAWRLGIRLVGIWEVPFFE